MSKVIWDKCSNFIYTFDADEDIFQQEYFKFFDSAICDMKSGYHLRVNQDYKINMISDNELMIKGPFSKSQYVIINGNTYYQTNAVDVIDPDFTKPVDGNIDPGFTAPEELEQSLKYEPFEYNEQIYIPKLDKGEKEKDIKLEIWKYTNEVYPDYPFKKIKQYLKLNDKYDLYVCRDEKNVIFIFKLNIDGKKYEYKYVSDKLCYFSTVENLKAFIKDLNLNITVGSDSEVQKLIQENSVKLKRRFGLTNDQTENPEYFPIFKQVVNLYCIESLISVSFINGNFITSSNEPGNAVNTSSLRLGKFSTGEDGGNDGYVLSKDLIKNLIEDAENDLYSSILKRSLNKPSKKFCVNDYGHAKVQTKFYRS